MVIFELVCDHCDKLICRNYEYLDHHIAMSEFECNCSIFINGNARRLQLCSDCMNEFDNIIIKFLDHESEV